jgi:hypothetical protein
MNLKQYNESVLTKYERASKSFTNSKQIKSINESNVDRAIRRDRNKLK